MVENVYTRNPGVMKLRVCVSCHVVHGFKGGRKFSPSNIALCLRYEGVHCDREETCNKLECFKAECTRSKVSMTKAIKLRLGTEILTLFQ